MGAKPSFYLKSGFSIAPAFSLNKNLDIASVTTSEPNQKRRIVQNDGGAR